jgi:hypothetical protein
MRSTCPIACGVCQAPALDPKDFFGQLLSLNTSYGQASPAIHTHLHVLAACALNGCNA